MCASQGARRSLANYFLDVSPGFFTTMRIGLIDGRELRPGDSQPKLTGDNQPSGGVGIVNEAFARAYFDGQNPVGKTVGVHEGKISLPRWRSLLRARRLLRQPARTNPSHSLRSHREKGRDLLHRPDYRRSAGAGAHIAGVISQARSEFRVGSVDIESALVLRHMIRERLLATISFFFAIVALVLAGVGLYGVLNYSVIQQRREIGIRMTLGARPGHVVRQITSSMFGMVCLGLSSGLGGGMACERFVESLLFEVKATNPRMMIAPLLTLLGATLLAALPPAIRAVKTDPSQTLRNE